LLDIASRASAIARGRIYVFLARRSVDVRGPLAGDSLVDDAARVEALALFAQRRGRTGLDFGPAPLVGMARMCADWSLFAAHPRVLFYRLSKELSPSAFASALEEMARWPLAPEVRAEWQRQRDKTPSRVVARALGAGRWACGRCDDEGVRAVRRWSNDGDESEPTAGEVEFQCPGCALRYWASWESSTPALSEPEPETWVVP
jgi:hypothetical protein